MCPYGKQRKCGGHPAMLGVMNAGILGIIILSVVAGLYIQFLVIKYAIKAALREDRAERAEGKNPVVG